MKNSNHGGETMHLVYATGQPGEFNFEIAETPDRVPRGARIFATCSGKSVAESCDEHTLHAMTDGEFYALQASIRHAREREAQHRRASGKAVDRILRWLIGREPKQNLSTQGAK
jgi:hypothetical protein